MEEQELDELAMLYRCEYCGANAGAQCRTLTGAKATRLHVTRLNGVTSAFGLGYQEATKAKRSMQMVGYPNTSSSSSTVTWSAG